jgi:NAD(P)-dependent dehydrogenase (short-subunit alcohol dehydrogenase family)
MALDLQGKVAVVTGASSGIGEATTRALAAAGATVVAVARRKERLDELAAEIPAVTAHAADVADEGAVRDLAAAVADAHGACHVLVNNAGFSRGHPFRGPDAVQDLVDHLEVNLVGAARCMAAFEDLLAASGPSRVINVGSVAGKVGVGPPAYAASKFGLVGLSEAARPDWAKRGIAVCQLNPGFVRTEGFPQDHLMRTPMGRLVITPEEVGEVVVELARTGARERTVPRWYRGVTVARHVAAPVFWGASRKML